MRYVLSLVAILAISGPAAAETARIAAWNLAGFHQIPDGRLDEIVDGMTKLDFDIIVLPELNPLSHAQTIADRLSEPADKCYQAEVPDQPRARQEIGFVFKCAVKVSKVGKDGMVLGSDLGKQGYRSAAAVHAKIGQFDFVLVGLHLKAGRSGSDRDRRDVPTLSFRR